MAVHPTELDGYWLLPSCVFEAPSEADPHASIPVVYALGHWKYFRNVRNATSVAECFVTKNMEATMFSRDGFQLFTRTARSVPLTGGAAGGETTTTTTATTSTATSGATLSSSTDQISGSHYCTVGTEKPSDACVSHVCSIVLRPDMIWSGDQVKLALLQALFNWCHGSMRRNHLTPEFFWCLSPSSNQVALCVDEFRVSGSTEEVLAVFFAVAIVSDSAELSYETHLAVIAKLKQQIDDVAKKLCSEIEGEEEDDVEGAIRGGLEKLQRGQAYVGVTEEEARLPGGFEAAVLTRIATKTVK